MTCNHEWGGVVIPGPVNRIVIDQCESCGELRLPDATPPAQAVDLGPQLDHYDAGLLGDGGGGDVNWWQDYIRAELDRAHEFY
ncbi:hypothetical protein ABE509_09280 [[Pseudomonas] hibiscicola]|uniref:hypothetical protein n=1 Tax=Stenotrophomonas hibiscicola TaxID=86189 RepID=UPI003207A321